MSILPKKRNDEFGVFRSALNNDMAFQVYRKVAWGTVVSPLTSLTPTLLKVNPNNDAVAGPNFTPGVYNLKVDVQAKTVELIPYK